jgi:hypothetical protein
MNGFVPVLTNDAKFTFLVKGSDFVQSLRMSLGSSKPVQPQRFSAVFSNAEAIVVHMAQSELRTIKVLRCS